MSTITERAAIYQMIDTFPEDMITELAHFMEFLQFKYRHAAPKTRFIPLKAKRKRGFAKQFNIVMADDFDAPLVDFMDYM